MQRTNDNKAAGNAQLIVLVVLAVVLGAGFLVLNLYTDGQKDMLTVETRGMTLIQALTKHKLEAGGYPDAIDKLVPKFTSAVPNCPGGGRMSYQAAGSEFTLGCPKVMFGKPYVYDSRSKAWKG